VLLVCSLRKQRRFAVRAADFKPVDAGHVIMIIRGGKVITDDEGLTIPDVSRAGRYRNYR